MPVYYRETVIDQPPSVGGTHRPPLQQQFSTGTTTRTSTTMLSPSESAFLVPDRTQSEDAIPLGTWPSAPFQHNKLPASKGPTRKDPAHFPMEIRVSHGSGGGRGGTGEEEVSRRSERWTREEFYPEGGGGEGGGGYPGYHKVTKEDYVIEEVVEGPRVVQPARIYQQMQPQPPQPPQLPVATRQPQQPQQPQQHPQTKYYQPPIVQNQKEPGRGQMQMHVQQPRAPPQVQPKPPQQQQNQPAQPTQQQQQQPQPTKQVQQQDQEQQTLAQFQQVQQPQQQVRPAELPQHQHARQHQYVQQQAQFQPQQTAQRREYVQQHSATIGQQQPHNAQIRQQKQIQQQKATQPAQLQAVQQPPQLQQYRMDQQEGYVQQQQVPGKQIPVDYPQPPQQQQIPKGQHQMVAQQREQQTVRTEVRRRQPQQSKEKEEEGEQGADDEPPPEMQLAQAPEELLRKMEEGEEEGHGRAGEGGGGGGSPERRRQHIMVNSPWYRQHPEFQQHPQYQDFRNYAEPLYIQAAQQEGEGSVQSQSPHKYYYQHFQPQHRVHQYFSPSSVKWDSVYEDEYPDGYPPPFAHGPGSPYDYLAYHQKVNLDRRRAESEQRRRHHSPVPGAAEHGYMFGGMDFIDHYQFNPYEDVGQPYDERVSRRDLHTGPPRRAGDFYGLDYTTMLPEGRPRDWTAEDAQYYHGYQALPPRKNFRLCGRYTADPEAPLNITEAQGLDQLDSDHLVGNTLSNQKCVPDRELTEEEKRTFALLYGPGGFKPDHLTIRPEPKPDEPPVFSTTIGPQKSHSTGGISPAAEGYVNPMKVEGESWMLGRRRAEQSQQGGHGLESAGGELAPPPFVRPARFPAHVPQWAKQRQQTMGRGAKSVDRSLFAPSWAKVPQPQPPYWVKRGGGGGGGGAETKEWKGREVKQGEEVREDQVAQQRQQPKQPQQQVVTQEQNKQHVWAVQNQQHNYQPEVRVQQQPEKPKVGQQQKHVVAQSQQEQPQQSEQSQTNTKTIVQQPQFHQQQNQQQQQFQRVQPQQQKPTTTVGNDRKNTAIYGQHHQQEQPQQQKQFAQQPQQTQVRTAQQHFEQQGPQEQPFDRPGGMYYFHESGGGRGGGEETSGLENLPMPKLGELALPESGGGRGGGGGRTFAGPGEQQRDRNRKEQQQLGQQHKVQAVPATQQEKQKKQEQTLREYRQKQWQQQPQDGDIFIDAHGRPVQYVRETEVDPRTGETVVREEWRLMAEEQAEPEDGSAAPPAVQHIRQQTAKH